MKSGFPIVASAMGPMLRRLSHTCRTRGEVDGRKKVRMSAHQRISTELVGPFPQFACYSYTTPSFQSHILRGFAIAIVKFAGMLFLHHVLAKTVKFATLSQTIKLADGERQCQNMHFNTNRNGKRGDISKHSLLQCHSSFKSPKLNASTIHMY